MIQNENVVFPGPAQAAAEELCFAEKTEICKPLSF